MEQILSEAAIAPGDLIKDSRTEDFVADVVEVSKETVVLVDFWAPWCEPCKQLTPTLEKVVTEAGGAIKLVKVNVDENQGLAEQLQVKSIPMVIAFKDGNPVDAFTGAIPESKIKTFIERFSGKLGPSPVESALEAAIAATEAGDHEAAANIYAQIVQHEPENAAALGGLARAYIEVGELDRAEETLALVPPAHANHKYITAAQSALVLARQSGDAGDAAEFKAKVEANPDDHQARFDLGVALFAAGRSEDAIDAFLEIIRRNLAWNDEAARTQLLKIFEALGPTDERTLSGRRQLSSVLFS